MNDNRDLARTTDPHTSHEAAERLNREVDTRHWLMWEIIDSMPEGLTSDEIARMAVHVGIYELHEQARRASRTMRDHGMLTPKLDQNGNVVTRRNASNRNAIVFRTGFPEMWRAADAV